jgi:hypothetical protein
MLEIFLIQLFAAVFGAISTAWADNLYDAARIGRRSHAVWVAASAALTCLPIVIWTSTVFLGQGLLGQTAVGVIVAAIFLGVHRNLPAPRLVRNLGSQTAQRPSSNSTPKHPDSVNKLFSG